MSKMTFARYLVCLVLVGDVFSAEECDKSKCAGPLRYYEDLRCQPIYAKSGDCCPISYDCSHLSNRTSDKCYANGREYAVGEKLKDEDRSGPCDIGCTCHEGYNNVATFSCAAVDCFNMNTKEGCYFRQALDSCCGGEEVCPKSPEDRIKCEVDGETYMDGEEFSPKNDPSLVCNCMEGYKGENIKPFCRNMTCGTEITRAYEIRENCVPVFYSSQSPMTSCSYAFRCQNYNDTVIPMAKEKSLENKSNEPNEKKEESGMADKMPDMTCKFGNMTMNIGDELNQATDYSSVCVKCVCEVPPVPTCQRLPDEECDVTKHADFA